MREAIRSRIEAARQGGIPAHEPPRKLTDRERVAIARLRCLHGVPTKALAQSFGVQCSTVAMAVDKWVTGGGV